MPFGELHVFERYPYRTDGWIVDVGANEGLYVDAFRGRRRVVAFEPHPTLHARLRERFGGDPGVTLVQKAVSDAAGELPFFTSEEHPGIHSLAAFHETHRPSGTVEVTTLREELRRLGVDAAAAVKIDVEGADLLALRGFPFDRLRPELVMVEFMDERSLPHFGYTHHDMAALMAGHGYATFVSSWSPVVSYARPGEEPTHRWLGFEPYSPAGNPAHGNLLFVPAGDEHRLRRAVAAARLAARRVDLAEAARLRLREVPGLRPAVRFAKRRLRR